MQWGFNAASPSGHKKIKELNREGAMNAKGEKSLQFLFRVIRVFAVTRI
jgi:hypothetical protein